MNQQLIVDVLYVVLFVAVATAEYFHILPQGTALALLSGFVVGFKTQSLQTNIGAKAPTMEGPTKNG